MLLYLLPIILIKIKFLIYYLKSNLKFRILFKINYYLNTISLLE